MRCFGRVDIARKAASAPRHFRQKVAIDRRSHAERVDARISDHARKIAQDLGYVVEEADLIRADLMLADEVFMTGTAAEVTPVRAVDDVEIGVGDVTLEIQKTYLDVVNGRSEQWSHWLDVVETVAAPA